MKTDEYVAAYRQIIPPNLDKWVVFRHGTVYELPEPKPGALPSNPREEAVAFLRMHGPVHAGSASGDFSAFKVKNDLGWLVQYAIDGVFKWYMSLRR